MGRFQKLFLRILLCFVWKGFQKNLWLTYFYALLENWSPFVFFILKWILFTVLPSPSLHLLRNKFLAVIIGRTILVSWLVTRLYFHLQICHGILKHKWGSYNQWQWNSKIQLQCFTIWLEMTDCNLDYSVLQLMLNCQ